MPHPFLSDEWLAAAREIRTRHGAQATDAEAIRVNLTITDVPFGDGTVEGHIDTSTGAAEFELGHLDDATVALTTDYDTAKVMFVDQDQAAGMQALMSGKVVVQGDLMQLLALNTMLTAAPNAAAIAAELQQITA